ncbi:MAG: HAMP domain-containing histidine kinase [Planctomycetia bacterium]|nr:MAG: HAMP domain-containing histidine kinase [Planctomycetia bacterium]
MARRTDRQPASAATAATTVRAVAPSADTARLPDLPAPSSNDFAQHRLALLGTLTAMVAHEISNLATPVLARAEVALESGDADTTRAALVRAAGSLQRAVDLTRRLLSAAAAREAVTCDCPLDRAVQEALELATRPLSADGIELHTSIPTGLLLRADPVLLTQLLLNLIINARRAMPGGGVLSISGVVEQDRAIVRVTDAGRGIPAAQVAGRFNPFLAARDDQPADWHPVGLGLAVCRTIARLHGAEMKIDSDAGRGCTITLVWPAVGAPPM